MDLNDYEASVAIWRGMRPVANGGWVSLKDGHFQLFDGKGRVLTEAPASEVWAKGKGLTMNSGTSTWVSGEKFMLSPGSGNRPKGLRLTPDGGGGAIGAAVVAHGIAFGAEFMEALEAHGGHRGKPTG